MRDWIVNHVFLYSSDKIKDHPVPEWAQQEVSRCPLTTGMLETWFPQSDQSGVSSHLMESMKYVDSGFTHFSINKYCIFEARVIYRVPH